MSTHELLSTVPTKLVIDKTFLIALKIKNDFYNEINNKQQYQYLFVFILFNAFDCDIVQCTFITLV